MSERSSSLRGGLVEVVRANLDREERVERRGEDDDVALINFEVSWEIREVRILRIGGVDVVVEPCRAG